MCSTERADALLGITTELERLGGGNEVNLGLVDDLITPGVVVAAATMPEAAAAAASVMSKVGGVGFLEDEGVTPVGVVGGGTAALEGGVFFLMAMAGLEGCSRKVRRLLSWG